MNMKFGKVFKKEMVPEWVNAYMDYNGLKAILREIRSTKELNTKNQTPLRTIQQKFSPYRISKGLSFEHLNHPDIRGDIENQVIDVRASPVGEGNRVVYKTKLLMPSEQGGETEVKFFRKLDEELNKVNAFYRDKVEQVLHEAGILSKQMDILMNLRIKIQNPGAPAVLNGNDPEEADVRGSQNEVSCSDIGTSNTDDEDGSSMAYGSANISHTFDGRFSVLKVIGKDSKERDLQVRKKELKEADNRLKLAFKEFYQKLRLLKQYSFMNLSAFAKIMKKYEKITSQYAARSYMELVDNSYLGSSEEVTGLLVKVENIFAKHFFSANRSEGMKLLRPKAKREKHRVTFFSGFFSGCSVALLIALVLLMQTRKLINQGERILYLDNMFQLYSFFAYVVLHILMYGTDIYFWRRFRVNYPFIFNFKQGTELGYREVVLLGTGLAVSALASFLLTFHMSMEAIATNHTNKSALAIGKLIPLGLFVFVQLILFCPFNIVYRSSRIFFLKCIWRCIFAPFYEVTLPDFFMGDQLTSQVQAIRSFEFYICYYCHWDLSQNQSKCHDSQVYNVFYFIVALVPYWIRCLQCLRRLMDEKDRTHAYNGLKYFTTIVAVIIRTVYELKQERVWLVLALFSSAFAMLYQTYWDIVVDWGLLRWRSKNFGLRDKMLVSHKSVYFAAMGVNVLLRAAWMQLVLEFQVPGLTKTAISTTITCLEIIRRGIWNFFRLENEHLNNVGKYRAFRSVPLPFNYKEDNKEDGEECGDSKED